MSLKESCPYCNFADDLEQHIVFENDTCYFLQHDRHQGVLEGSGIIIPKVHRENTFELTKEEWNDTYELMQQAQAYLHEKHSPDGFTLGWNVGEASNQSILHSHFHIIPRYNDEPFAGKGLRHWIKKPENRRPKAAE